jgi:hypothetical protein
VTFDDWVLALHVLSAFSLVAGIVLFWVLVFAVRRADTPAGVLRLGPLAMVAQAAVGIGVLGTIVLGVWLAFSVGGYDIWDGWIIAAIVLWLIATGLGQRTSAAHEHGVRKAIELEQAGQTGPSAELAAINRAPTGALLHAAASAAVLLLLIDMIWKPGA